MSLHLAELAILPMQKVLAQMMLPKIPNVPSTKVLVVRNFEMYNSSNA